MEGRKDWKRNYAWGEKVCLESSHGMGGEMFSDTWKSGGAGLPKSEKQTPYHLFAECHIKTKRHTPA